jgi:carotenoid cleavage dioxygenase-like enzyme
VIGADHDIDGDVLVTSVALKDGKAFFRNRFVRTLEHRIPGFLVL